MNNLSFQANQARMDDLLRAAAERRRISQGSGKDKRPAAWRIRSLRRVPRRSIPRQPAAA